MSKASSRAEAGTEDWIERLRPWIAALLTALLHLLILILAMSSSPITLTTPQGAAAGSREQVTEVTFIDQAPPSPQPPRAKPASTAAANKPVKAPPAASRVRSTLVMQADDPVPPDAATPTTPLAPEPVQRPSATTAPADAPGDAAQGQASTESPPPPARRRSRTYGQPPGMLPQATAPANAGLAMSPAVNQGRRNDASSAQANMEVGGYQVYYDLLNEIKLRAWRDRGMTELFLPLPGIRQYMVCPLEVALKRESGACRLVEPNAPELDAIGDAREVINMQRVYRRGEVIWRGPGAYR